MGSWGKRPALAMPATDRDQVHASAAEPDVGSAPHGLLLSMGPSCAKQGEGGAPLPRLQAGILVYCWPLRLATLGRCATFACQALSAGYSSVTVILTKAACRKAQNTVMSAIEKFSPAT